MLSDVTTGHRAENCVGNRMQRHVSIGVPLQADFIWNIQSAEFEADTPSKTVNVEALTNAHIRHEPNLRSAFKSFKSDAVVSFGFGWPATTLRTLKPASSSSADSSVHSRMGSTLSQASTREAT